MQEGLGYGNWMKDAGLSDGWYTGLMIFEGLKEEANGKWVRAKDLAPTDKLLLSDGKYAIITAIEAEELSEPQTTYNLEIEDFHTYYVGEQRVCVHNSCENYKLFQPEGKDGYRATINANETEAPHAHIFKRQNSIGRIFRDGTIDKSLKSDRTAIKSVKKYYPQIMKLIDNYYGR